MVVVLPTNVPVPLTRLIGREAEIMTIRRHVNAGTRSLTLSGPGGVGKTRLALAVAADLREDFTGDVVFVDCVAFVDASQMIAAIVRGLRLEPAGVVSLDALASTIEQRRALFILDNVEQVVGVGGLVTRLIARCRRLIIIATSRIRLDVPVEVVVDVAPLATNPVRQPTQSASSPAVQLFVERARTAYPEFTLTAGNAPIVEAICRRLDGLPLAIELAAARIPVLAPAAMLSRIERQLSVIDGGDRSLPDRHRSLRATLDWSYDLLGPVEQRRFRHLGIFSGSFDRAAALAILVERTDEPVSATQQSRQVGRWLASLERQSLLVRVSSESSRAGQRYDMLATIRTHAQSLSRNDPEREAIAERHFAWYLQIATEAEGKLNGSQAARWLERLDQDIANLRQALRFAIVAGRTADGTALAVALWRYWESRGLLQEGVDAFDRLLGQDNVDSLEPALRGTALNHLANLLTDLGQFRRAADLYTESLALRRSVGESGPVADTLNNLGLLSMAFGDFGLARRQFGEALAIRRLTSDRWGEALAIANLGDVEVSEGQAGLAIVLHEQALAIRGEIGDERGIAFSTSNLAEANRLAGDRTRAGQLLSQASRRFERLGVPLGESLVRRTQGDLDTDDGQHRRALGHYREALIGFDRIGDRGRVAEMLDRIGATLVALDTHRDGVVVLGAADQIRTETGLVRTPTDVPLFDEASAVGRRRLGATVAEATLAIGRVVDFRSVLEMIGAAADGLSGGEWPIPDSGMSKPTGTTERAAVIAGLTGREREVLALLSEGLTNAEIAHRLYVSTYTVSAHLRRIFRHLGVTTRTAAMQRWVSDQGG